MDLTPEHVGANVGSGVLGTLIAWFTLKGKIERMIVIHAEFKKTTEAALTRIESSLREHSTKVVYTDTCTVCKENKNIQLEALHEKLDMLLERRKESRHEPER